MIHPDTSFGYGLSFQNLARIFGLPSDGNQKRVGGSGGAPPVQAGEALSVGEERQVG